MKVCARYSAMIAQLQICRGAKKNCGTSAGSAGYQPSGVGVCAGRTSAAPMGPGFAGSSGYGCTYGAIGRAIGFGWFQVAPGCGSCGYGCGERKFCRWSTSEDI